MFKSSQHKLFRYLISRGCCAPCYCINFRYIQRIQSLITHLSYTWSQKHINSFVHMIDWYTFLSCGNSTHLYIFLEWKDLLLLPRYLSFTHIMHVICSYIHSFPPYFLCSHKLFFKSYVIVSEKHTWDINNKYNNIILFITF